MSEEALLSTRRCRVGEGQGKNGASKGRDAVEQGGANATSAGNSLKKETGSDYGKVKGELADADSFIVKTAQEFLGMQYIVSSRLDSASTLTLPDI